VATKAMGGAAGKWVELNMSILDPVDVVAPIGIIESHSGITLW
jgi:hypothetical protein